MPPFRSLSRLAIAAFVALSGSAHACLFERDTTAAQWYEWGQTLLAGDVTAVAPDKAGALDTITVGVVETFKGPPAAATATVQIPTRIWATCRLERPAVGAHVLVAMHANGDAFVVPLPAPLAEDLRRRKKAP